MFLHLAQAFFGDDFVLILVVQKTNFVSTWYEAGQRDINFKNYDVVFPKVPKQTTGYENLT
jgi:hypothetical protein